MLPTLGATFSYFFRTPVTNQTFLGISNRGPNADVVYNSTLFRYNATTGLFDLHQLLPVARAAGWLAFSASSIANNSRAVSSSSDEFFLFVGADDDRFLSSIYRYNPATNLFTLTSYSPDARGIRSAAFFTIGQTTYFAASRGYNASAQSPFDVSSVIYAMSVS